ncbi:MAG: ATP-binding cassette domain-containing protein [Candidatus Kapabacteria bacterium]|nr:ATP-binding cassette domain-containing protein [Candidatus Kapabacteria bacterium]
MIEVRNLSKSFGSNIVLDNVDLNIENGQTMCIIGKSGCGKSVLLKHIVGLLAADSGTVKVDGKNINQLNKSELFDLRRDIGYVFQGAALFDSYTVFENVVIGLLEHGVKDKQILRSEAERCLSAVGLLPDKSEVSEDEFLRAWDILSNKKPSDLSGGMRKRVGVARALVGSPKYIFYDEPTTGLDPVTSEQIDFLISDIAKKVKVTSLVITHDMFSVFLIANKVAMLNNGKVQFYGTPDQLRQSDDPVVKEFLERYN